MLFNTTQFFVFLLVVLTLFYAAPQSWRRYILLAASYYFYVCWNAKFLLLLLTLTATDYLAALWIAPSQGLRRRVALVAGLAANLGFLGYFKYLFHPRPPDSNEALHGVLQILLGLTKKMALADPFALVADTYFSNPAAMPGLRPAWGAVVAFALQIFFDFSGYSDIAIGAAKLLGFRFPANFERPYLSTSIT